MTSIVIAEPAAPPDKGLRAGALGLVSSVVIAVSSTAPAYSMAATLGLIVAIVGVHSPGTLIVSLLPMLCIAYAFRELNKADPDCGITFTWAARAFGPRTGWMGGSGDHRGRRHRHGEPVPDRWALLSCSVRRLWSSVLHLLGHLRRCRVYRAVDRDLLSGHRGLGPSATGAAGHRVGRADRLRRRRFGQGGNRSCSPRGRALVCRLADPWNGSFGSLSNSFLLAVFIYWGWDCALSVNEETKDTHGPPAAPLSRPR